MLKHWVIVFAVAAGIVALSLSGSTNDFLQNYDSIKELSNSPSDFVGENVTVKGSLRLSGGEDYVIERNGYTIQVKCDLGPDRPRRNSYVVSGVLSYEENPVDYDFSKNSLNYEKDYFIVCNKIKRGL